MNPCPTCTRPLVAITLDLNGQAATLSSCSRCELRAWNLDGQTIAPEYVFAAARTSWQSGNRKPEAA